MDGEPPPAWCRVVNGQRRVSASFAYRGIESAIEDDEEPVKQNIVMALCFPKKEPSVEDPWAWQTAMPERHIWWWDGTLPRCDVREKWWHDDDAQRRAMRWDPENDEDNVMQHMAGGLRLALLRFVDQITGGSHIAAIQEEELENALRPCEWYPMYRLFPMKVPQNLDLMLQKIPSSSFSQYDTLYGGNLLWHAARKGDTLVCRRLIELGFGSLGRETAAFDGRTAFEIALCSGFPDTAFLLEPYARIRCTLQKKKLDTLLLRELEFLCSCPNSYVPPRTDSRKGLFTRIISHLSLPSMSRLSVSTSP